MSSRPAKTSRDATKGAIRSMTGFGKASFGSKRFDGSIEVRSFNHRYLKVALKIPSVLASYDTRIEQVVRERIARGSVSLAIKLSPGKDRLPYTFDPAQVEGYIHALKELKKRYRLDGDPTLEMVASLPEILVADTEVGGATESDWRALRTGVLAALDALVGMRTAEGRKAARDIVRRRKRIETKVAMVRKRAPSVVDSYHKKLRHRINNLLAGMDSTVQDADLSRELAFFADRCDISEEIERLQSHLNQFDEIVASAEEAGRRLEFILHEMFRETNTIGSKANDSGISHLVVEIKAEIEKIREQVQNIE